MRIEEIEGTGQDGRRTEGLRAGSALWLITRDGGGRPERLCVDCDRGGAALAVFGYQEEAEMFLGFWAPGDGWRARKVGPGELASSLRDPSWAVAQHVALDPLPAALAGALGGAAELDLPVGMDRDRFAKRLARGDVRQG